MDAFESIVNLALVDIGIRIQLSRTNHDLAVGRYQTISDYIDRRDSELHGLVQLLYPQGGMAIGATISSRLQNDEFDIDIIAQLNLFPDTPPATVLDLTYRAIKGKRGSRYFEVTERNTRCVTVQYDQMHLDITPAILIPSRAPRTSTIFHSKREEPRHLDRSLIANPFGFVEWYQQVTPPDDAFATSYAKRATSNDIAWARSRADSEPVPDPYYRKSTATVVLQLLKRWRNVCYDQREGRRPPSVLITKLVADSTTGTGDLLQELQLQVEKLVHVFGKLDRNAQLIHVTNPTCHEDVLTDRWPMSLNEQRVFLNDLRYLQQQLKALASGVDLSRMKAILMSLFGEHPTQRVFDDLNNRLGHLVESGDSRYRPKPAPFDTGRLVVTTPTASDRVQRRRHTFYGSS